MKNGNEVNLFNAPKGVDIIPGILIMIQNYWGRGRTIDEAWNNVRSEAGGTLAQLKKQTHLIYSVLHYESKKKDETIFCHVNAMGSLCSHVDYPPHLIAEHKTKK